MLALLFAGRQHEIFAVEADQIPNFSSFKDDLHFDQLIFRKRMSKSCVERCRKDVEFYQFIMQKHFALEFRVEMKVVSEEYFGFPGLLMQDLRWITFSTKQHHQEDKASSVTLEFKPKLCERYLSRACRFCCLNRMRYGRSFSYCPYSYFGAGNLNESRILKVNESQHPLSSPAINNNNPSFHSPLQDLLGTKFLKVLSGDANAVFEGCLHSPHHHNQQQLSMMLQALEAALQKSFKTHSSKILHLFPMLDWDHLEDWLQSSSSSSSSRLPPDQQIFNSQLQLYKELVSIRDVSLMITFVRMPSDWQQQNDNEFKVFPQFPPDSSGRLLWARCKLIDLDDKLNEEKIVEHSGQTREILDFLVANPHFSCRQ